MWITQRFRTIAVFPINWERLDAGVFTSMLPATKRKSRTSATRETDVISERQHCSRKRRHTQVDFRTRRKCADKTQTIARKRWHGARKRKRSNVRSTCGRLVCDAKVHLINNNTGSSNGRGIMHFSSVFTREDTSSLPVPETKFNGSEGKGWDS